ncbi:MAG: ABC transporter ATP-binding protein [Halieaceae bacterium]|jgi:glycerol transport system ATP-binding protein|nr:ABC transporter ATP-binding protein [Halieaceae bacterium]
MLELIQVNKVVDGEATLEDVNLTLSNNAINILLGPTLSGKTTLMRVMAGLDRPSSGDILFNGESVIGVPVQKRNVAMVYQQFINYPSLTVFENIASPLRVLKVDSRSIIKKVQRAAAMLQITDLLDRTPEQLSGGQQQRVALARALAKRAKLVLLDEPLANLDYKLREELRSDLPKLFSEQGAILVYATTEPIEALLLAGKTAVMHEGRVRQFGTTIEVFNNPRDITAARVFSDPPLNIGTVTKMGALLNLGEYSLPLGSQANDLTDTEYQVGIRPHNISLNRDGENSVEILGTVTVSEITGSESFIHFHFADCHWVALVHGIHIFGQGEEIQLYLNPETFYFFYRDGKLAQAPEDSIR